MAGTSAPKKASTPKSASAMKSTAADSNFGVRRVAIIGGNRIPFARSNTVYTNSSNLDMLTVALDGLVERYGLEGERVGEFVASAVLKHSRDFNLARETVLGSKLSPETPANDLQQACDTGIQAAIQIANKIALGKIESGIAGGADTTSDAPLAVGEKLRKILLEANRAKDLKGRIAALIKVRPPTLCRRFRRTPNPVRGSPWATTRRSRRSRWISRAPNRTNLR